MQVSHFFITPAMTNNSTNTPASYKFMYRWSAVQTELIPEIRDEVGVLTPKLEKVIHTLEWVRIEEFVAASWCGTGRPPHERAWLANAFVAKAVLGLTTTLGLIERLRVDRALRRICGFPLWRKLPSESTFSRAFDEFARNRLPERVHEALVKEHLGEELIGHLSRDGTAIEARERPVRPAAAEKASETAVESPQRKRGRPRRGESRAPAKESPLERQRQQTLTQRHLQKSRRSATGARSAMPEATRSAGTATSCTWTRPTAVCRSVRCCPRPRCTTAVPPCPCR